MPRLAASVALRIASGTSRALPWPYPTRPFWSPTTTSAANPKRRPPFTTFATRLMWTRRSTNSLSRSSFLRSRPRPPSSRAIVSFRHFRGTPDGRRSLPLEFQAALAGALGERLDAPVMQIAATVEHVLANAPLLRPLGEFLADKPRGLDRRAGLELLSHGLLERRRGGD